MPLRALLVAAAAAVTLLALPMQASAWQSDRFRDPTGNVRCQFNPSRESLTCASASPRRSVTLWRNGRTSRGRAYLPAVGPVLRYGRYWSSDTGIECFPGQSSMDCGHGGGWFHISRQGIYTGTDAFDY